MNIFKTGTPLNRDPRDRRDARDARDAPHPLSIPLADHQLAWHLTDDLHDRRCSDCRREALAVVGCPDADPDHPEIVAAMRDLGGHHDPEWAAGRVRAAAARSMPRPGWLRRTWSSKRTRQRAAQ